jgi:hypothetical protein
VRLFDDLLGAKSDQHANDDNSDFTGERSPAMKRLGQMNVHARDPRAQLGPFNQIS